MEEALNGAKLVVNATPVGLHGDDFPVPIELLPEGCAVFDLAYQRNGNAVGVGGARSGASCADGLGMLIEQGAIAFRMWFGVEPDRTAMWKSIA